MKRHIDDRGHHSKKVKSEHVHTLRTDDLDRFDKKFPFFRQPNEIGAFSVNIDRQFKDDKSQLKYYIEPHDKNINFDLRKGYKDMIRKDEGRKEYINFILSWICKHEDKFQLQGTQDKEMDNNHRNLHTDFVCWRGLLTKLLCTPYENREGWQIAVTLYNGTYYINLHTDFVCWRGLLTKLLCTPYENREGWQIAVTLYKGTYYINLHTDFVCWRGLLTKLLCTPYENREGWQIAVTLYNGTYYMCEFDTQHKIDRETNKTEREDEMCCWGWKFEQYLTADSQTDKPDTKSTYNNCENFCTVVRSRLNQHSLVFSGEVDAITDGDNTSKPHYVEMKTTREVTHPRQSVSLKRFKYIKWWAQSFLVGIPEIVCGYRTDDGVVTKLESLQTQHIPDMVKDLHNPWKPNVCFNFLDEFLSFIKQTVKIDDPKVVHLVSWEPKEHVTCKQLAPDSEFVFLPDWYTDVT